MHDRVAARGKVQIPYQYKLRATLILPADGSSISGIFDALFTSEIDRGRERVVAPKCRHKATKVDAYRCLILFIYSGSDSAPLV